MSLKMPINMLCSVFAYIYRIGLECNEPLEQINLILFVIAKQKLHCRLGLAEFMF